MNTPELSYRDHISDSLFESGSCSDVTIEAFGKEYKLHKAFLIRSPFFHTMFNWNASSFGENSPPKVDVHSIETEDEYITKQSFEQLLKRLYGIEDIVEEKKIPFNMIAVGHYFQLLEVIETAVDYVTKNMSMLEVSHYSRFVCDRVTNKRAYVEILKAAKFCLSTEGWESGSENWDGIPIEIVIEVLGDDKFYVQTEYHRALFTIVLMERRLSKQLTNEADLLKRFLREDICYPVISFEGLMDLAKYADNKSERYVPFKTFVEALSFFNPLQKNDRKTYFYTADTGRSVVPVLDRTSPFPPLRLGLKLKDLKSKTEKFTQGFNYGGTTFRISTVNDELRIFRNCTCFNPWSTVGYYDTQTFGSDGRHYIKRGPDRSGTMVYFSAPKHLEMPGKSKIFFDYFSCSTSSLKSEGKLHSCYIRVYSTKANSADNSFITYSCKMDSLAKCPDPTAEERYIGPRGHTMSYQKLHKLCSDNYVSIKLSSLTADKLEPNELTLMIIIGLF